MGEGDKLRVEKNHVTRYGTYERPPYVRKSFVSSALAVVLVPALTRLICPRGIGSVHVCVCAPLCSWPAPGGFPGRQRPPHHRQRRRRREADASRIDGVRIWFSFLKFLLLCRFVPRWCSIVWVRVLMFHVTSLGVLHVSCLLWCRTCFPTASGSLELEWQFVPEGGQSVMRVLHVQYLGAVFRFSSNLRRTAHGMPACCT